MAAVDVLDFKTAAGDVSNKLTFVVAFKWIAEHKVVGHDLLHGRSIAAHHRFHPLIIYLPQVLFDFETGSRFTHVRFLTVQTTRFYARSPAESTAWNQRILFRLVSAKVTPFGLENRVSESKIRSGMFIAKQTAGRVRNENKA